MAILQSGLFVATMRDVFDTTQLAVDLDLDTHKLSLFQNSITPNRSTDTAYGVAPYNANESSGGSWPAGGVVLANTTFLESPAGVLKWDADDISVANTTLAAFRGLLIYADALAGNNAIMIIALPQDYSTNNGTLQITWPVAGIWTWPLPAI